MLINSYTRLSLLFRNSQFSGSKLQQIMLSAMLYGDVNYFWYDGNYIWLSFSTYLEAKDYSDVKSTSYTYFGNGIVFDESFDNVKTNGCIFISGSYNTGLYDPHVSWKKQYRIGGSSYTIAQANDDYFIDNVNVHSIGYEQHNKIKELLIYKVGVNYNNLNLNVL